MSVSAACVYSQVPAFAASDRGMLDVLTATHDGRLAVLELKADEISTCRCKDWTTGPGYSGTMAAQSSSSSVISRDTNYRMPRRYCSWYHQPCASIPPQTPSFVTSLGILIGPW